VIERIPIWTFVNDDESYIEMRRSFVESGFTPDRATFIRLESQGRPGDPEPYSTISNLVATCTAPYFILCHQDVRLDQGHGFEQFARVITELDEYDPFWVVAGNAGGCAHLRMIRCITDPHGASIPDSLPTRVESLDENFLVFKTGTGIHCSAELRGFHLYAADFCLNALMLARSPYVIDFRLRHLSGGKKPPTYFADRDRFVALWSRHFNGRFLRSSTDVHFFSRSRFLTATLGSPTIRRIVKNHSLIATLVTTVVAPLDGLRGKPGRVRGRSAELAGVTPRPWSASTEPPGRDPELTLPLVDGTPRVTVVIPNWNGVYLLSRVCLPSLARQSFRDFEVIVVDNGSVDGSCDYLASAWSEVRIVALGRNRGFPVAVNAGIKASASEYIALVNNDVELDVDWLEHLVIGLDQNTAAGSVTGKLLNFHNRDRIASAGDTITWDGVCDGRGRGQLDTGQHDLTEPVFSGTGAATLYRRSAFHRVGLFDEDFFAVLEDVDWGFRAQLVGLSCWYIPAARAYHLGGVTRKRVSGLLAFLLIRNTLWLALKNLPGPVLRKNSLRVLLISTLRSYRSMRGGVFRPVVKAWLSATCGIPKMMRKRRVIQANRLVDIEHLDELFGPQHLGSPKLSRLKARLVVRTKNGGALDCE
jgi:GT2 family glycosyltransferase